MFYRKIFEHFCTKNIRVSGSGGVEEQGIENQKGKTKGFFNNPEVVESLEKIPAILEDFLPMIKQHMSEEIGVWRQSWVYLFYHSQICALFADFLLAGARGNLEEAEKALETMEFRVAEMEPYIHNVFDLFLFIRNARGRINKRMPAYFS